MFGHCHKQETVVDSLDTQNASLEPPGDFLKFSPLDLRIGRQVAVIAACLKAAGGLLAWGAASPLLAIDPSLPAAALETRRLGPAEGLPAGEIFAFEQTADRFLWIGTESGLFRYDGRAFQAPERGRLPGAYGEAVESLATDAQGYLFVGLRRSGLMRFNGRNFLAVSRPASGDWRVSVLEERPDGLLWVAGPDQLWHLDRGGNSVKPALPGVGIRHLFTDAHGATWVAARSGLFRRIGAAFQPVTLPFGRSAPDARALALDGQGHLWLAPAGGGLWRLSGNYERGGLPQEIAEEKPFDDILVEKALTDRHGMLWLATGDGLYRQTAAGLEKVPAVAGACRTLFEDADGDIWVGGQGGLWQVYEQRAARPELQPALARITTADGEYLPASRLELAGGQKNLRLELAAPYYEPGVRPRFRWKLEGADSDWKESSTGIADYGEIPAGRNLFRAQATFGPTFTGPELRLEIVAPRQPWRDPTIWLAAIAGLGLAGGLVLLSLRRAAVRQREEEEEEP